MKIDYEIQNENYLAAVEHLLYEYRSNSDVNLLESIHIILSKKIIAYRLNDELLDELNIFFEMNGFTPINKSLYIDNIGVAEFPVVGEDSVRAIIVTSDNENNKLDERINNKKELLKAIDYVQKKVQINLRDDKNEKIQDITILNWGLKFDIRKHLLTGTKLQPEHENYRVEGNSLHFAAVSACISKLFNLEINPHFIFTGAFDQYGDSIGVESLIKKTELIKRERPNIATIFIPPFNKFNNEEKTYIESNSQIFSQVLNIEELIKKVFDQNLEELSKMNLSKRKTLGYARVWAEYIGKKNLVFCKDYETITTDRICLLLNFIRPDNDAKAYKIFPVDKLFHNFEDPAFPNFIIINGGMANTYMGNIVSSNQYRSYNGIIGIRDGVGSPDVMVFAARDGSGLAGYKCNFF